MEKAGGKTERVGKRLWFLSSSLVGNYAGNLV